MCRRSPLSLLLGMFSIPIARGKNKFLDANPTSWFRLFERPRKDISRRAVHNLRHPAARSDACGGKIDQRSVEVKETYKQEQSRLGRFRYEPWGTGPKRE